MALLFMESWDGYGGTTAHATKWYSPGNFISSSPTPRTGTRCNQSNDIGRNIAPGDATLIAGWAFYWGGIAAGALYVYANSGGNNNQYSLILDSDGKIRLYHSATFVGPLLEASASAVLISGSWNFIEMKVLCANSGTWAVKVNGITVLSGSGDTMAQGTAALASIQWVCGTNNAVDDLYLLDGTGSYLNDFIGDCKVECLTPQTGNGTNTGLTCSTGSDHGALVDEFPATDDTDYNYGATPGVKDTYNFTNLATTGTVYAVQATIRAKKTDSATKTLALVARENSTDSDGTTQGVGSTTYGQYSQIWEKRPSDVAAWTVSDVNGGEFGMKVVA